MKPVASPIFRLVFVLVLALVAGLGGVGPLARAQAPATKASPATSLAPSVEALPPTTYLARQDGVPVRVDPGFVYREIGKLAKGDKVTIDGRQGQWLRVRGGGWIFQDHAWTEADAAAAPPAASKLVVLRDGARVRESASTASPVIDTLKADTVIEAVAELDGWWRLASGGFISASLVRPQDKTPRGAAAARASVPDRPLPWVVAADSVNVRAGRGSEFPVVRRAVRGEIVTVTSVVEGWAEVPGGWVRQDLLEPPAPPRASRRAANASSQRMPRRWSFMDLGGVLVEVFEFPDKSVPEGIRAEMRANDKLESDWTMLGISIAVAPDAEAPFSYSPLVNATKAWDKQGQLYGNIYVKGPLERLPAHVRLLLDAQEINPGDRFNGVLLFRPTLEPSEIRDMTFALNGAAHRMIADR